MKSVNKYFFLLPLVVIALELVWFVNTSAPSRGQSPLPPPADTSKIFELLKTAGNSPKNIRINNADSEIEFSISNKTSVETIVILSTQKNPYQQVNALQKLLKIANIKGQQVQFIDLSSLRPYATL